MKLKTIKHYWSHLTEKTKWTFWPIQYLEKSLVKPSGSEIFFVKRSLVTQFILLVEQFLISIIPWFTLGKLCFPRNLNIFPYFQIYWQKLIIKHLYVYRLQRLYLWLLLHSSYRFFVCSPSTCDQTWQRLVNFINLYPPKQPTFAFVDTFSCIFVF